MSNPPYGPLPVLFPLYPKPPFVWKQDRGLFLLCRAQPGRLRQVVPFPLEIAADDLVIVAIKVCRDVSAPKAPDFVIQEQYRLDFTVPVSYGDIHGEYPVLEYINDDMGLCVGRELWNWPKKLGSFDWKEQDGTFHAECARHGRVLMASDFSPDGAGGDDAAWPSAGQGLTLRPIGSTGDDSAPRQVEVVRVPFPNFKLHSRTYGRASLKMFDGVDDPIGSFFGPLEILSARFDVRDFDFDWGEVVATVDVPSRGAARERDAVDLLVNGKLAAR